MQGFLRTFDHWKRFLEMIGRKHPRIEKILLDCDARDFRPHYGITPVITPYFKAFFRNCSKLDDFNLMLRGQGSLGDLRQSDWEEIISDCFYEENGRRMRSIEVLDCLDGEEDVGMESDGSESSDVPLWFPGEE